MWLWGNWWDVVSDLSVYHRIRKPARLPPQRLIDLAWRIGAYGGVVANRARSEQEENETVSSEEIDGMRTIDGSTANLAADPVFTDLIEFG